MANSVYTDQTAPLKLSSLIQVYIVCSGIETVCVYYIGSLAEVNMNPEPLQGSFTLHATQCSLQSYTFPYENPPFLGSQKFDFFGLIITILGLIITFLTAKP